MPPSQEAHTSSKRHAPPGQEWPDLLFACCIYLCIFGIFLVYLLIFKHVYLVYFYVLNLYFLGMISCIYYMCVMVSCMMLIVHVVVCLYYACFYYFCIILVKMLCLFIYLFMIWIPVYVYCFRANQPSFWFVGKGENLFCRNS